MNYRIVILHPFTPKAAGVIESAVPAYHSQPHVKALMEYAELTGNHCSIDYFTQSWFAYTKSNGTLNWNFYPVTVQFNGNHRKWLKQKSNACLRQYSAHTPDVTIINMSAHASMFCFELSKIILRNDKQYIAMLGGQHYSDNSWLREYYLNAHHIIVHTQRQKKQMEQMALFEGKTIRVMPLGVDCDLFVPKKDIEPAAAPNLLYVGRISRNKQVHLCIETLNKLIRNGYPNSKLVIIGPVADKSYIKELENTIASLELNANISFYSQMGHTELIPYYQQADLFLFPSLSESFGMVMIESMSCGTPVAAITNSGGPEEVIEHYIDGVLVASDQFTEAVYNLIQSPEVLRTMSVNARRKVLNRYSIESSYLALSESITVALNDQ